MNKKPKTKTKVFQMRCDQYFLDQLDELRSELDMNRSEFVEFAVGLFPVLKEMLNDKRD